MSLLCVGWFAIELIHFSFAHLHSARGALVRVGVACGIGIHAQYDKTALAGAADRGHADCVRLLLDAGADENVTNHVRVRVAASLALYWRFLFDASS